jgi:molecular chaperone GrpE
MAESQTHEADTAPEEAPSEPDPQLLRALADLDNLRKRYERELASAAEAERKRVTSSWLAVVDDLERALAFADGNSGPLAEGVRAVYEHAISLLVRLGFHRFDDHGEPFDPVRHEAVGAIEADAPPGRIVATVRPGYERGDEVLRPARVVVARKPE